MRQLCIWLLAAVLALGFVAAEPAQAKVYKMTPEERSAALKDKKTQRKKSKKSGKPVPGQDQGGWVEVKPGEKIAKKNRKDKVDELAKKLEKKAKDKKGSAEVKGAKQDKKAKDGKQDKKLSSKKADAQKVDAKKSDATKSVDGKKGAKVEKEATKKAGRKSATYGDRLVGRDYTGERKVSASSTEVRRPASGVAPAAASPSAAAPVSVPAPAPAPATVPGAKADEFNSYSVSRPGQGKALARPEVRHEVQPGPVDAAKPVGTEPKAGEGRF